MDRKIATPKILVVDDRPENLIATRKILKSIDAEVIEAQSGNEALSKMLRHQFAAVLLDVQMPEMDGFEVATLMQEHESMRQTPIIFVTAISKEEQYVDQAAALGAVDYIFKPINANILRSKVQVYIDLYCHQARLSLLNAELERSLDELERFAYICSHDLQEPVRMMGAFADLLKQRYAETLDEDGCKYVEIISKNASYMRQMINDILEFSRIGREEVKVEPVDCAAVLQDVLVKFETQIREKRAVIHQEDLPVLRSSTTLVNILLQNLVGNALKFSNGDRPVEISIRCEERADMWLFSVADNGIGIEPKYREKVFAAFQRLHPNEDYPGTGIGLSTCKKYVELFGGSIWFESTPGDGTTFFFTLPKDKPASVAMSA